MLEVIVKTITLAAFIITAWYAAYRCNQESLNKLVMQYASLWGVLGAILGGYVFTVIIASNSPAAVMTSNIELLNVLQGSKGTLGAFIGAALFSATYLLLRGESFLKYADAAVPAVALGYAVARIACFVNGDDFGIVTDAPWAVEFWPGSDAYLVHLERAWISNDFGHSLPVHATQLYHALAGLIGCVLLARWQPSCAGDRLALGLAFYGITRFIIQFYRDEHWSAGTGIDTTQWICLLFITIGLLLWVKNALSNHNKIFGFLVKKDA